MEIIKLMWGALKRIAVEGFRGAATGSSQTTLSLTRDINLMKWLCLHFQNCFLHNIPSQVHKYIYILHGQNFLTLIVIAVKSVQA